MAKKEAVSTLGQHAQDFAETFRASRGKTSPSESAQPREKKRLPQFVKAASGLLVIAALVVSGALYVGDRMETDTWSDTHHAQCDSKQTVDDRVICHIETEILRYKHLKEQGDLSGSLRTWISIKDGDRQLLHDGSTVTDVTSADPDYSQIDTDLAALHELDDSHKKNLAIFADISYMHHVDSVNVGYEQTSMDVYESYLAAVSDGKTYIGIPPLWLVRSTYLCPQYQTHSKGYAFRDAQEGPTYRTQGPFVIYGYEMSEGYVSDKNLMEFARLLSFAPSDTRERAMNWLRNHGRIG